MAQRTYRLQSGQAPRVLFELSRTGRRLPPVVASPASGAAAAVDVDQQERYEAEGTIASVEHVEHLGWFCVLRADDPAAVDALAQKLGLTPATIETRAYADLLGLPAASPAPAVPSAAAPAPAVAGRPRPGRDDLLVLAALAALALAVLYGLPVAVVMLVLVLAMLWAAGRATERRG